MLPLVEHSERETRLRTILGRRASFSKAIDEAAARIVDDVRTAGDDAVRALTRTFDGIELQDIKVPESALATAYDTLDADFEKVLREAERNIRRFHERQRQASWFMEDGDGVVLGQRVLPLERAGVYVPGGKAFYPSSLLMNVIPAQVAGVPDIHLASPPGPNGMPHTLVLAAAHMLGVRHVYAMGGAQAVAALAYGTETVPRVDIIVGPGNAYVASAKRQVFGPVAIDSIAGPSEIVVLADASANPAFVGADLLSQAEHDERASAILVTTSRALAEQVQAYVADTVPTLPKKDILEASLVAFGACIIAPTEEAAIAMVNDLAPEHLELIVEDPWKTMTQIRHAGAIFLGPYSTEPVGDYFAGPNHVLPTGGTARYASALSVDDFVRKQSVIAYTSERLAKTGPSIIRFAEAEDLHAHALAVRVRLTTLED